MGSHSALQRHRRGSEIDSFDVSIMNSFALDLKLSLLVTSSSGGMPSELFKRLLRVSTFCVEAPGHRFGEREYGDVFEKPNGRRNRIVRMADFFSALSSLTKINILSPSNILGSLRPTFFGRQGIETAPHTPAGAIFRVTKTIDKYSCRFINIPESFDISRISIFRQDVISG